MFLGFLYIQEAWSCVTGNNHDSIVKISTDITVRIIKCSLEFI